MKTVAFNKVKKPTNPDEWVRSAGALVQEQPTAAPAQPMKRLTIDVSVDLHTRLKLECTRRGFKIADVLREMLEREFPKS
jgi:hypothetical protein